MESFGAGYIITIRTLHVIYIWKMSDGVSLDNHYTELFQSAKSGEKEKGFHLRLEGGDKALLMNALANNDYRVQKIDLSSCAVWIKRQSTEQPSLGLKALTLMSRILPYAFMRPSPVLDPEGMMHREIESAGSFMNAGSQCRKSFILRQPRSSSRMSD